MIAVDMRDDIEFVGHIIVIRARVVSFSFPPWRFPLPAVAVPVSRRCSSRFPIPHSRRRRSGIGLQYVEAA